MNQPYNPLNAVLVKLHANFRKLRQLTDTQLRKIKSMVAANASDGDVRAEISKLRSRLKEIDAVQQHLCKVLKIRHICYSNFQERQKRGDEHLSRTYYILSLIVNWLERRNLSAQAQALVEKYPLLEVLSDRKEYRQLHTLISNYNDGKLKLVIEWCKQNRSALKKSGISIESRLLMMYATNANVALAERIHIMEKVFNSNEFEAEGCYAAAHSLFGGVRLNPLYTETDQAEYETQIKKSFNVTAEELESAYLLINGLPPRNMLLNYVLVGVSLFKTKSCTFANDKTANAAYNACLSSKSVVNNDAAGKIVEFLKVRNVNCPTCQPFMEPLCKFAPFAIESENTVGSAFVKTHAEYVIRYQDLEEYMLKFWPDLFKGNEYIDITGEKHSIDSLVPVFDV